MTTPWPLPDMPLTNAQKQKDTRARRKAKLERLARLEGALREIADMRGDPVSSDIARKALGEHL